MLWQLILLSLAFLLLAAGLQQLGRGHLSCHRQPAHYLCSSTCWWRNHDPHVTVNSTGGKVDFCQRYQHIMESGIHLSWELQSHHANERRKGYTKVTPLENYQTSMHDRQTRPTIFMTSPQDSELEKGKNLSVRQPQSHHVQTMLMMFVQGLLWYSDPCNFTST